MTIKYQKKKIIYWVFFASFFVGLITTAWAAFLFENTVVNWKLPIIIFLLTGFLFTPITSLALTKYCKVDNIILKVFFNLVSFGGILVGFLMVINYYFSYGKERSYKSEIINRGYSKSRGMRSVLYADVKINDIEKRLKFPHNIELKKYKFVEVDVQKGLLGFYIITNRRATIQ